MHFLFGFSAILKIYFCSTLYFKLFKIIIALKIVVYNITLYLNKYYKKFNLTFLSNQKFIILYYSSIRDFVHFFYSAWV